MKNPDNRLARLLQDHNGWRRGAGMRARVSDVDDAGDHFTHLDLDLVTVERSQLIGTRFTSVSMRGSRWEACRFDGTIFYDVDGTGTTFRGCRFDRSHLEHCDLSSTTFIGCTFTGCRFDRLSCRNATFDECRFDDCRWRTLRFDTPPAAANAPLTTVEGFSKGTVFFDVPSAWDAFTASSVANPFVDHSRIALPTNEFATEDAVMDSGWIGARLVACHWIACSFERVRFAESLLVRSCFDACRWDDVNFDRGHWHELEILDCVGDRITGHAVRGRRVCWEGSRFHTMHLRQSLLLNQSWGRDPWRHRVRSGRGVPPRIT